MYLARILCCIAVTGILTGQSALGAEKGRGQRPADHKEKRVVSFDSAATAQRIADSLKVLLESHPQGANLAVGVTDDGTLWLRGTSEFADQLYESILRPMVSEPKPGKRARRGGRGPRQVMKMEVRVFELMFADARVMARYVEMLGAGPGVPWVTAFDERTNSIIAKGPPELIAEAAGLIEQLDRPSDREEQAVRVIKLVPLSRADAQELAKVVKHVLDVGRRGSGPSFEAVADRRSNTIVLAGPEQLIMRAADLIQSLDAKTKAAPSARKKGKDKGKQAKGQGKAKGKDKSAGKGKGKGEAAPKTKKKAKDGAKPANKGKAKAAEKAGPAKSAS